MTTFRASAKDSMYIKGVGSVGKKLVEIGRSKAPVDDATLNEINNEIAGLEAVRIRVASESGVLLRDPLQPKGELIIAKGPSKE